uniref:Uncharacterized protein n=2 Tax=Epichloe TaxID=5112 RepID=A0A1J0D0B3_EPINE|nr:hypothetical protein [Epichloe festucae]APB96796.1 hypothetical protein [Epichloe festucae]APB96856.1 hypothetical protein [Epichloe hybrida]
MIKTILMNNKNEFHHFYVNNYEMRYQKNNCNFSNTVYYFSTCQTFRSGLKDDVSDENTYNYQSTNKINSNNYYDFTESIFSNIRGFLDYDHINQYQKQEMLEDFLNQQYKTFVQNKTSYKYLGIDTSSISKPLKELLFNQFKDDFFIYLNKFLDSSKNKKSSDYDFYHYQILSHIKLDDIYTIVLFCYLQLVTKIHDKENFVDRRI